jgi:hypothetical protein
LGRRWLGDLAPLIFGIKNLDAAPVLGFWDDALVAVVHQLLAVSAGWASLGQPVF